MNIKINETTKQIIKKELGVKHLSEIIDMDYVDINDNDDFSRELIMTVNKKVRGSVRLHNGLFYTNKEFNEKRSEILNLKFS